MVKPSVIGGTFDPLHDGHKALFEKAFELSDEILIGLTSDSMAQAYRTRKVTEYKKRKSRLASYIKRTYPGKKYSIVKMDEIFNLPIITEIKEGFLIISEGKVQVARNINKTRKLYGSKPFEIIAVPYILAADGMPIKATRIHEGDIDIHGKMTKRPVIAVGSKNRLKLESVKLAFNDAFGDCQVKSVEVSSGVKPQPLGKETIIGACNRAVDALEHCKSKQKPVFGVGLEAGLFWIPTLKDYMDVSYCVIVDRRGHRTFGQSPGFTYPPEFKKHIWKGEEISVIVEEIYKVKNIGKKNGAIGYLTDDLIIRKELLISAVKMALVPRIKQQLYR